MKYKMSNNMASPRVKHSDNSDKNCLSTCRLQYGISEAFEQILKEQQKLKLSKSHVYPKIFNCPKDQKLFNHMLSDVMFRIFSAPDEQKVFRIALEGMKRNYPEIFKGCEQNMFYAPTAFNFDSRIGKTSAVPDVLDQMQASLESKQNLTANDKSNLKKIQAHLRKLRPQLAEQEFADALACFFYQRRGIFIHSLKLDDHLKVLTNKAKLHRKQNKSIRFSFTDLEKKLKEQFDISDQHLEHKADIIVKHLSGQTAISAGQKIKGLVVRGAIKHQFKGNERMYALKLFETRQDYTLDEVKEGVKLGIFESECHVSGENDLLVMLPDSKLILCVEIKRHMSCKDHQSDTQAIPNICGNMRGASSQLKKNARFFSKMHGAILSPGWQFAKVCAISPALYNSEKICKNCKKFILTSQILKTPKGLEKWWKETGLSDRSKKIDQKEKDKAYVEFQLFFFRLICLSSVRVVPDPFHTWTQIQGNNKNHMAAGHTRTTTKEKKSGDLDVDEVLKSAHSAFKTLFFNKDQRALLTTDKFPYAVFLCDFGAGKSLVGKERAIQTADIQSLNLSPDPVFFISLVGVDSKGLVEEHEHIFDIYSKEYDFYGCEVKAISAQDLWNFYKYRHKDADRSQIVVYTMAEFFVEQNSNGHFVLDECPFRRRGNAYDAKSINDLKNFIGNCRRHLKSNSNLFWVALQSNQLADISNVNDDFKEALNAMKEDLTNDGWILPQLESNMRNQMNISNINVEGKGIYGMQSSIAKLKSGTSIIGEIPLLFKVKSFETWKKKKDQILVHCLQEINKRDKKNVVVVHDDLLFKDVGNDLKRLIKGKTVVEYPSSQGKQKDISNLKAFIEQDDHILFTKTDYFNGCEASNIIYLNNHSIGYRNCLMRAVENVFCIQVNSLGQILGMKEDLTFYEESDSESDSDSDVSDDSNNSDDSDDSSEDEIGNVVDNSDAQWSMGLLDAHVDAYLDVYLDDLDVLSLI